MDLFSGIGGITLGLGRWVRPIAYCENDRYAQSVLLSRMSDGLLPRAPIWDDVRTFDGKPFRRKIDIVYGGFPCQDISVAGLRKGLGGEQSGLFFHIARLVEEINPRFIFLENVPAIRTRGLNSVVQTFTELGYDSRWTIVSAQEVGACHVRKRWFLLAHAKSEGLEGSRDRAVWMEKRKPKPSLQNESVAYSQCDKGWAQPGWGGGADRKNSPDYLDSSQWLSEPNVDRVVDGLPPELDFFIFECEEDYVSLIKSGNQKEIREINLFNREVLRKVWEHKDLATASPDLYLGRLYDLMPTLPQRSARSGEVLGQRIQQGGNLHDLWLNFYSASEQTEQALWQSRLLKRIWQIKCDEEMAKASRVDRVKGLGNAVVPLQAKAAFEKLIGLKWQDKRTDSDSAS